MKPIDKNGTEILPGDQIKVDHYSVPGTVKTIQNDRLFGIIIVWLNGDSPNYAAPSECEVLFQDPRKLLKKMPI